MRLLAARRMRSGRAANGELVEPLNKSGTVPAFLSVVKQTEPCTISKLTPMALTPNLKSKDPAPDNLRRGKLVGDHRSPLQWRKKVELHFRKYGEICIDGEPQFSYGFLFRIYLCDRLNSARTSLRAALCQGLSICWTPITGSWRPNRNRPSFAVEVSVWRG